MLNFSIIFIDATLLAETRQYLQRRETSRRCVVLFAHSPHYLHVCDTIWQPIEYMKNSVAVWMCTGWRDDSRWHCHEMYLMSSYDNVCINYKNTGVLWKHELQRYGRVCCFTYRIRCSDWTVPTIESRASQAIEICADESSDMNLRGSYNELMTRQPHDAGGWSAEI